MIDVKVDVSEEFASYERGVANSRVLKNSIVAAQKKHILPQVVANYGGANSGPKRVTGAMSAKSATKVKGLWFNKTKTAVSIVGLRTKNVTIKTLSKKKMHGINSWHLNQITSGQGGKYRTKRGTVANPRKGFLGIGADKTFAGNKPWKINSSIGMETKQGKRKARNVVIVRRDPSRIAHIIEKGHKWPKSGGETTAYEVVTKAYKSHGNIALKAAVKDMHKRAEAAAKRAAAKAEARMKS